MESVIWRRSCRRSGCGACLCRQALTSAFHHSGGQGDSWRAPRRCRDEGPYAPGATFGRSRPGGHPGAAAERCAWSPTGTAICCTRTPTRWRCSGFPDHPSHLVGRSLVSLGFEEGDAPRVNDLVTQVVHGRPWEGTLATSSRQTGPGCSSGPGPPPCYDPSGEISGVVAHGPRGHHGGSRASGTGSGCWSGSGSGWPARSSSMSRSATSRRRWCRSSPIIA